jgi:hypothetical protein
VPRSILLRLSDIRTAIIGIQDLTAGVTLDGFANSWAMQRAVERGLEIISEASRHVPDDLKALAPNPLASDRRDRQSAAARISARRHDGDMEHRRATSAVSGHRDQSIDH